MKRIRLFYVRSFYLSVGKQSTKVCTAISGLFLPKHQSTVVPCQVDVVSFWQMQDGSRVVAFISSKTRSTGVGQ